MTAGVPGAPSDGETIVEILAHYEDDGATNSITPLAGGHLRWSGCSHEANAADVVVGEYRRFEGASDPADMAIAFQAACPTCGQLGQGVLGYGPNTSAHDGDVLVALALPPHAAAGQHPLRPAPPGTFPA